ncbi:MAG: TIR domain-containing protein [Candidatus Thiodiazotropha endolucinida]
MLKNLDGSYDVRCNANTKSGVRCKNPAKNGSRFCSIHSENIDFDGTAATVLGAVIGNALIPGLGGLIGGGLAGNVTNRLIREKAVAKKRVFVSFDFDNDRKLKEFIVAQSRLPDSPFEVIDCSLKEAAPEANWEAKANAAIKRSQVVIVMVGPHTHRASGVLKEIKMARNADKHIVQVIGYRNGDYTPVPNAGRLYRWNWENLKNILS